MEASRTNLLGASSGRYLGLVEELKEAPFRVRQIFAGIYRRRLSDWDQFSDLGKPLRQRLEDIDTRSSIPSRQDLFF